MTMHDPSMAPLGAGRGREHGQILVLFAFVLISLLLVSALAVDYGGWLLARRTYQNTADQAAISGAYLLTSSITDSCSATISSKNQCARQAAWQSIQNQLSLTSLNPSTQAVSSTPSGTPYTENGYRIWVDSPPSDAGSAYPGYASSQKTIFVRVERDLSANFSRIISPQTRIGAWATAGRIPSSFAIILLCQTSCHGQAYNLKVNGGSTLILASGDIGSNSYLNTAGSNAYVALGPNSSAYMNVPSQCNAGNVSCQLVAYNTTTGTVDTSTQYSGLAMPQTVDPAYAVPTMSSTAVPWQCNGTGTISMGNGTVLANANGNSNAASGVGLVHGPVVADGNGGWQMQLDSAVQPPTPAPITLGVNATISGTITASSGGAKVQGITVGLTNGGTTTTSAPSDVNGFWSVSVKTGKQYSLQATDSTNVYRTYTQNVPTSGTVGADMTVNFAMDKILW
jgi:Flp pilus assembly protein TadG